MNLSDVVNLGEHPVNESSYQRDCKDRLEQHGVLALAGFITDPALKTMREEAERGRAKAYFCAQRHSVYLTPDNLDFDADHPANRKVVSSKGCICDDDVRQDSPLRLLYNAPEFQDFVKAVTGEMELHPYADPLSSINIHYAGRGQELGWHFDNSEFAITLLIEKPDAGARFEYVRDLRDSAAGDMNYEQVEQLLDGKLTPTVLDIAPGTLVLFRGRNSIHRVSPNESDKTRVLAVLAYNSQPGISLSESARMTFYGRLS